MIALIIEMTGKTVPAVSMELMALALRLKEKTGLGIRALVYGKGAEEGAQWIARESGEETLGLEWDEDRLTEMEVTAALKGALKSLGPQYLLFPHTPSAMDTAPALAVFFGIPLVPGVVRFDAESGTFYRSAGGGKSLLHVETKKGAVVTIQPGAFAAAPKAHRTGAIALKKISPPKGPTRILSTHTQETGSSNLPGARVVVSVGRGIETKENLPLFTQFAEAIPGAAKGCSRPLVDMGWMPYPCQVGITGTAISADLYIALGISGSTQHLAGIPQNTTVVSVNRDPNAAIHSISDLIIEADLIPFMEATLALTAKEKNMPPAAR